MVGHPIQQDVMELTLLLRKWCQHLSYQMREEVAGQRGCPEIAGELGE